MNINVISEIKQQLVERGELPQAQRQFLIDAFSRIEAGEAPADAFDRAELPVVERGKRSQSYKEAVKARNRGLKEALTHMPGPSDWKRCEQLAELSGRVWRSSRSRHPYKPGTESEEILLRIIESGARLLVTPRRIHEVVSPTNQTD